MKSHRLSHRSLPYARTLSRSRTAAIALLLVVIGLAVSGRSAAAQAIIVEEFFVPLPEDALFRSFDTINSAATGPIQSSVSIAIGGSTNIVYDQWENGYEASLASPLDIFSSGASGCPPENPAGTQIWGNSNQCDGAPPGFGADVLSNGDVIELANAIPVPRNPAEIRYDGADKFGVSYPVAVTKLSFPAAPGSVLAGGVEVQRSATWGTEYRAPVGENLAGVTDPWDYTVAYVMARVNGTEVFRNGSSLGVLDAGENLVVQVNVNDRITASDPVQVDLITGDIGSTYEMRWYSLPPLTRWSGVYYMPVGDSQQRVGVWLYNPNQTGAITVQWQIGPATGSLSVPAGGAVFSATVGGTDGRTGARFFTSNGEPFFALAQVDLVSRGEIFDWGFPLVPEELLSPQVLVGGGRGCTQPGITIGDDSCALGNTANARSFVWVMPTSGTNVPVYVAFDGRLPVCPATTGDYDTTFALSTLRIQTVQDAADLDMSGARIWTCAPNVNLAVAWGQDPARSYTGDDQGLDLGTLVVPLPSLQLEKSSAFATDPDGDGAISPGDEITYTLAAVNSGAFPAVIEFRDSLPPELVYVPQSTRFRIVGGATTVVPDNSPPNSPFPLDEGGLTTINGAPIVVGRGQVAEVLYRVTIDPATDCTLTLRNRAQIISVIGSASSTDESEEIIVLQCNPGIDVEKSTNGQDADAPTGPFVSVGGGVTWAYTVRNIGDVALSNIRLVDDRLGSITTGCTPAIPATFAVGASFTCVRSGTAQSGQYENLATVTASSVISAAQVVSDTDPSNYYGAEPSIEIIKGTNGENADTPTGPLISAGDTVTWDYFVVNTGNVTLTNVTVTDDVLGAVACPKTVMPPADFMICTVTGIALSGQYSNTGTVVGTPPVGPNVTDSDPSHYFGFAPAVEIEKATNGVDADLPPGPTIRIGDFVEWTYVVTNTGNVELNIDVTDDQGVDVVCPQPVLLPQQSTSCTGFGIATAGQYSNTGTVVGQPPIGSPVTDSDPSHYNGRAIVATPRPEIRIVKLTNAANADLPPGPSIQAGATVTWTYFVLNSGNITLTNVTLTDDRIGAVTCPENELSSLELTICTANGIAQAGQYSNTATVVGSPSDGQPDVSASDPSHYFGSSPALDIQKNTNGVDADFPPGPLIEPGSAVTWTYVVTNTGNVILADVEVTDSENVSVICPKRVLAPRESMTCLAVDTALFGQYTNIGTVVGVPPVGQAISATDPSHYFGALPDIDIEKATNSEDADLPPGPLVAVGGTVSWTYVVTNTGNVALTRVVVNDDQGVSVVCPKTTLAAGEVMTCTATASAQEGQYANTGVVTGTPPIGTDVFDSDPSHYFGAVAGLDLEKYTNGENADTPTGPLIVVGGDVLWTYELRNTGNVPLANFSVVDSKGVPVACPRIAFIGPGDTVLCRGSGSAVAGQYANSATATAVPPIGPPLTDTDPSHYFGVDAGIDLEKTTNGEDADVPTGPSVVIGDPVVWTYSVTNTSNVPLRDVAVTDIPLGPIACPKTTLAVGEAIVCSAPPGIAARGQYSNTSEVIAFPPEGAEVLDDDPSHYFGVERPTSLDDAPQPGPRSRRLFLPRVDN